ncbi:NPCBM/NEW2 domain-containing protein [Kitasatospora sp. MBT63]|uniref:NPCBM/NEW2 domain-containing protein n=1 Tax=Kitasatospora sp. MBT63 TaxID=1444768 RepID=UPI0034CD404B
MIRRGDPVAQRRAVWMRGSAHQHALSVRVPSQVTIDLNRGCTAFDAVAGLDDLSVGAGSVEFRVEGADGRALWQSGRVGPWDRPVAVHAALAGQTSIRLVVTPASGRWPLIDVADWADARFTCS